MPSPANSSVRLFVAPYVPESYGNARKYIPPQALHFMDAQGHFHLRPFVYGTTLTRDSVTLRERYTEDRTRVFPIYFLARGDPYTMWGLFESDLHLFGLHTDDENATLFLLGSDRMGRDTASRLAYGARISLSIGLVGVLLELVIGIVLGGVSGYYGGVTDTLIQRAIEFLRSMPGIPLWMSLAAAVPSNWPVVRVYFSITVILSLIGWTGLARVVRGRFLALREEDFVMSARLVGSSEMRIILRHMVPSFTSYIIAATTLSIPDMIDLLPSGALQQAGGDGRTQSAAAKDIDRPILRHFVQALRQQGEVNVLRVADAPDGL